MVAEGKFFRRLLLLSLLKVSQLKQILERTARRQKFDARRQKACFSLNKRVGQEEKGRMKRLPIELSKIYH